MKAWLLPLDLKVDEVPKRLEIYRLQTLPLHIVCGRDDERDQNLKEEYDDFSEYDMVGVK